MTVLGSSPIPRPLQKKLASASDGVEKGKHLYTVGKAIMENSIVVPKKMKTRTTLWTNHLTTAYIANRNEISVLKRYLHSYDHHSRIHSSQDMETTYVSTDRRMVKKICVVHRGILPSHENWGVVSLVMTGISLEDVMLREINQTCKDKGSHFPVKSKKWNVHGIESGS